MDILAASVSHGGSKKMMNIKVHRFMNGNEKELARFEYTIKNDGMILTTVEREKNHFSGTVQFHGKKGFRTRLPWEAKMDDISNRVSTGTVFTGIKKQQNQNWIFLKAWDEESIPAHSDPSLKKNVLNGDINAAIAVSVESKKAQN